MEESGGQVVIDGRPLREPYLAEDELTFTLDPEVVPRGHVFVLGEKVADSSDSRSFGAVAEDAIVVRAFLRIWPIDDIALT